MYCSCTNNFAYRFPAGCVNGFSEHLSALWLSLHGPLHRIILKKHLIPLTSCWSFSSRFFLGSQFALGLSCHHQKGGGMGCWCFREAAVGCSLLLSSPYSKVWIRVGEKPGKSQAWQLVSMWLEAWCDLCSRKGIKFAGHYLRSTAGAPGTVPAHCSML